MAMEQITFNKKSQYGLYLRQALSKTLKPGGFNIFLHCVTTAYPRPIKPIKEKDEVLSKVNGILQDGLNLDGGQERCPYGSINGTAKFMGETQGVNIEEVINYNFLCNSRHVNTIILAIPKYIGLKTGLHEFSSFKGTMKDFNRFKKSCLLDISKGRYLPPEFTFGYQVVDREANTVKFWQNPRHFSLLSREEQDQIMQNFSTRIESVIDYCRSTHNASSLEDVFDIMTHKHLDLLEDYFNDI